MQQSQRAAERHLVLIGLGHTNAHILRMWKMHGFEDTDLTCISNDAIATYSGMLPAVLAQQIPRSRMEIDLVQLCSSAGARLLTNAVTSLDTRQQLVFFDDRPPVPFDALSIGIGSVPSMEGVELGWAKSGDDDNTVDERHGLVKIKPMQTFIERLSEAVRRVGKRHLQVAIVGGGVAGVEIAFCLPPTLNELGVDATVTIVNRGAGVLTSMAKGTRRRIEREIEKRGIQVVAGAAVTRVEQSQLVLANGTRVHSDIVIWATGASPPPLLKRLGLPLTERGFLATHNTLQTTHPENPPIFAVGDTGTMEGHKLPKSGVYAVRQGPLLWDNLRRALYSHSLQPFVPQKTFMRLINLGDGRAVGQWRGLSFAGRWAMRWKDRIDQRFMDKFIPQPMTSDEPMQCRGCGCKLGPTPLADALESLASSGHCILRDDASEVGPQAAEGARQLLASTDFFALPFDDAFLSGRVAALHAASDLIAMGANVSQALANLVAPEGRVEDQQRYVHDFLTGAQQEFQTMGASIVGGHTTVGPRPEAGFTVIGEAIRAPLLKSALMPGDRLMLTKPIGIGALLASHMRSRCRATDFVSLLETMLASQHEFGAIAERLQIKAATDVTGFGLGGHLLEMLTASGMSATVRLRDVPLLPGALEVVADGIQSSLSPQNQSWLKYANVTAGVTDADSLNRLSLLSDPQTCGGLLVGVPEKDVHEFAHSVQLAWGSTPSVIGTVETSADATVISLE